LTTGALWYEKLIVTGRTDVDIVSGLPSNWPALTADMQGRPIFYTGAESPGAGSSLERFRNVGRLVPMERTSSP
jgi:hypothetical protein